MILSLPNLPKETHTFFWCDDVSFHFSISFTLTQTQTNRIQLCIKRRKYLQRQSNQFLVWYLKYTFFKCMFRTTCTFPSRIRVKWNKIQFNCKLIFFFLSTYIYVTLTYINIVMRLADLGFEDSFLCAFISKPFLCVTNDIWFYTSAVIRHLTDREHPCKKTCNISNFKSVSFKSTK